MEGIYSSEFLQVNQVRLHVKIAGPEDGPPVILLHGFPEFWYGWRRQIPALASAGYRVVVPDQRGYNLSDKPKGIRSYTLDLLARDVVGLLDGLDYQEAYLVGHDWGAIAAWWAAAQYPERVKRLAILNGPHPDVIRHNIIHNPVQRRKSSYILFFQLPLLPELFLSYHDHQAAARILERSSLPGSYLAEDIARYRAAWSHPGAWTGMLNWYRAIRSGVLSERMPAKVQPPTLIIWGEKDAALHAEMAHQSLEICLDGRLKLIPEATHWVQLDAAQQVNAWLVDFFGQDGN
jgi:pimeloyl-ACP methyl ester carboxylesterase